MEIIINYLDSMFASLPNTEEVRKAKAEMASMMEDKYTELKAEGKSEKEAQLRFLKKLPVYTGR